MTDTEQTIAHHDDGRRWFMRLAREAKREGDRNGVDYWVSQARWFHADVMHAIRGEPVSEWIPTPPAPPPRAHDPA